jgi:hypothetical protein
VSRPTTGWFAWRRIERQAAFHESVEKNTQGPGVGLTSIVGLAEENLWGSIVFTAATGSQER